tara:strand:+ start:894 stop:1133 length:240 start_codon:yes stop_codon:yes gene_type:complete
MNMNKDEAQMLIARYNLAYKSPFSQPAYVIAYAIADKDMAYLPALGWVKKMYKDNRFADYTGTWQDTLRVIDMYTEVRQ